MIRCEAEVLSYMTSDDPSMDLGGVISCDRSMHVQVKNYQQG
jgi:hypothetical protein